VVYTLSKWSSFLADTAMFLGFGGLVQSQRLLFGDVGLISLSSQSSLGKLWTCTLRAPFQLKKKHTVFACYALWHICKWGRKRTFSKRWSQSRG
jgi:hypothetical protein